MQREKLHVPKICGRQEDPRPPGAHPHLHHTRQDDRAARPRRLPDPAEEP